MPKSKSRRKHKAPQRSAEESSADNSGGVMSSLRGGFKRVAAGERKGSRTPLQRAFDIAFWVLVLAAVLFFAVRRFQ